MNTTLLFGHVQSLRKTVKEKQNMGWGKQAVTHVEGTKLWNFNSFHLENLHICQPKFIQKDFPFCIWTSSQFHGPEPKPRSFYIIRRVEGSLEGKIHFLSIFSQSSHWRNTLILFLIKWYYGLLTVHKDEDEDKDKGRHCNLSISYSHGGVVAQR